MNRLNISDLQVAAGTTNHPIFSITTYAEGILHVSLQFGPLEGLFGACVNSTVFWVLGFMPLSFWMVPFSLSFSLPPYLYRRRTPPSPLCLATGFTAFGYAAALPFPPSFPSSLHSRSHPSVFRPSGAPPSLPLSPFFPAVGLGIKIRHFIVSKFCEADNIAAPIAAPPPPPLPPRERGNPSVLVLLPHK